jgi:hypothetical protein
MSDISRSANEHPTPGRISVRTAGNSDANGWDTFLNRYETVPPLCHYVWRGVLEKLYRADTHFYVATDDQGDIVGVLPAYITKNRKGRKQLYTLHRGVIAATPAAQEALLRTLNGISREQELNSLQFSAPMPLASWPHPPTVKRSLILRVAPTTEEAWSGLRAKTRNMIRKAQKHDLVAERGHHNLKAFYDIYTRHMLSLGVPIYGFALFREIAQRLPAESELIVARHGNEIVSGLLIIFGKKTGLYPFQATKVEHRNLAATQFLIWEAVKCAVERNVSRIDMGESRLDSPVYRSKINFGGIPEEIFYYDSPPPQPAKAPSEANIVRTIARPAAASLRNILTTRSPMWVRRRYGLWRRKHNRLLF